MSCRVEVRLGAIISYRYIALGRQNWRIEGFEGFETAWMPYWGCSAPLPLGKPVVIPLWIPALMFGMILFLCRPLFHHRRRKRKKLGLCLKCGYDLRGSKEQCPECGVAIPLHVSVTVNPVERFSRLSFPGLSERFSPEDPPIDVTDYTTYECDRCSKQIRLDLHSFKNAMVQPVTNLSQDDERQMTKALGRTRSYIREWFPSRARKDGLGADRFLDWYCPGCGRAVRVYFSSWAGGKGDFFVDVLKLLESR